MASVYKAFGWCAADVLVLRQVDYAGAEKIAIEAITKSTGNKQDVLHLTVAEARQLKRQLTAAIKAAKGGQ